MDLVKLAEEYMAAWRAPDWSVIDDLDWWFGRQVRVVQRRFMYEIRRIESPDTLLPL